MEDRAGECASVERELERSFMQKREDALSFRNVGAVGENDWVALVKDVVRMTEGGAEET